MKASSPLLFLSREDVLACGGADMTKAVRDVRSGFRLWSDGRVVLPLKTTLKPCGAGNERDSGLVNFLPAYVDTRPVRIFSCKALGAMPSNVASGLPRATGLVLLFDPRTKVPCCVMDAQVISATRTGAVTALAAGKLADLGAEEVGLVGAGVNMRTQLLGLKAALPRLRRAKVFSRGESKRSFAKAMAARTGLEILPADSCEEAVRGCPVVVTCIPNSASPVLRREWVREGGVTLFNIGAYEMEFELLRGMDRVVCDAWEHSKHRRVQTHVRAVESGAIEESRIEGLAPILSGGKPGRSAREERIYFSPVGLGFEDALLASRVYREARRRGVGTRLALWSSPEWI